MNAAHAFIRKLFFLMCVALSQEGLAIPIMTTGQSGSDIFVRAHNFENRNYMCTVQFSWTGDGMPPNVNHNSTSTVPAKQINFLLVHHQTTLANVRITSGPIMICHENA